MELPLPAISEQRRIVEILEQADTLRKKRAEADAKSARILQALFYKMFGDPVTNPKTWPTETLEAVTSIIHRYPTFYGVEYVEDGTPVVRISDIMPNNILNRDMKSYVKVPSQFSEKFPLTILEPYDLVMAVRGDTTGKMGLALEELKGANISPNLIRISPRSDKVGSLYLFSFLLFTPHLLGQLITNTAKKSITATNFKSIRILVPERSTQDQYENTARGLLLLGERRSLIVRSMNNLWSTLLHRAFTGDLTARWREAHMSELLMEIESQAKLLFTGLDGRSK